MKIIGLFFLLFIFIGLPFFSLEAQSLIPANTENCNCSLRLNSLSDECRKYCGGYTLNEILGVAVKATQILLGLSGSVALLFFVYGGVTFLISGGSAEKVTKGKTILINSVIGIIIIFTSFTIIQFTMTAMGYSGLSEWNQSK